MKRTALAAGLSLSVLLALAASGLAAPPAAPPLAEALDRALADGWRQLRIVAECRVEGRMPRVEVLGNGVGTWNDDSQFTLSREEVRSLLLAFRERGFASLRPSYGGKRDPAPPAPQPPRLTCRVELRLDGAGHQVVQLQHGRQSEELRLLAGQVLDACRAKAAAGVRAADLDDGLAKVASGALAPEALHVLVTRRPEPGKGAGDARGFVLRVEHGRASPEGWAVPGEGPADVPLAEGEVAGLARLLRQEGAADLPANLYAEEYTDLVVTVLGREKRVQARRFAGMNPSTKGAAQERFDRILEALAERHRRWLAR